MRGARKLTSEEVLAVYYDPRPHGQISGQYRIGRQLVTDIKCKRARRKDTEKEPDRDYTRRLDRPRAILTPAQAWKIYNNQRPSVLLAKQFGVSTSTIRAIRNGRLWRRAIQERQERIGATQK